jgi:hypothetical protein
MKLSSRLALPMALVVGLVLGVFGARFGLASATGGNLASAADARGLTGEQAEAALATYTPPGAHDPYYLIASGGHSGQVHVVGVPSMQLLKTIPLFSPDSWSGYGFGASWADEVRGTERRQPGHLGRLAPPRDLRDRRGLRRPLGLHQRPRQRPPRDDRPA